MEPTKDDLEEPTIPELPTDEVIKTMTLAMQEIEKANTSQRKRY